MDRVAEEDWLSVAPSIVRRPRAGSLGAVVVDRVVSVGTEMADIFAVVGIDDEDAAVAIAVGDIETVGFGIHYHVRRRIEQRRAVNAAIGVVAVWCVRRSANPHLEIAIHVKLQDE